MITSQRYNSAQDLGGMACKTAVFFRVGWLAGALVWVGFRVFFSEGLDDPTRCWESESMV